MNTETTIIVGTVGNGIATHWINTELQVTGCGRSTVGKRVEEYPIPRNDQNYTPVCNRCEGVNTGRIR